MQKVQFRGIAQTENRRGSDLDCTKVKTVQMYFVKYTLNITHILSTHIWIALRQKECIQTILVIEGLSSSIVNEEEGFAINRKHIEEKEGGWELAKLMGMC